VIKLNLHDFAKYKHIVIQCHDIPDADAVGSGFALQRFLRALGADPMLVYGGREPITKPSLCLMIETLRIEIAHVGELPADTDLVVTVDCQYGAGNIQRFPAPAFAVIDHHRAEIPEGENTFIRPALASCATLVWDLIRGDYDVDGDYNVLNALYYGLFTDTNGLSEMRHPLDRDLAELAYDAGLVKKLKNCAITLDELSVVAGALSNYEIIGSIGLFQANPCDPNILGFTSDIAQQVERLDCCVLYCCLPFGVKLSVRSCAREIMGDELARWLCRDVGSGGGGIEKAGGFIQIKNLKDVPPEEYLRTRLREYLTAYDLIYADDHRVDFTSMPRFQKLPNPQGFAKASDIFGPKARITVRTLEGDVDIAAEDNVYIMIGVSGEVYPIHREKFERSYVVRDEPYAETTEYVPSVINKATGEKKSILPFAQSCAPVEEKYVRAAALTKDTKVFTNWDLEKYYFGAPGDYLVANEGDWNDCYIVRQDIFLNSYTVL
jgi:phosphoglycolate phosphatase